MSSGQEAFILWYQVGEQSPVVVGGSVVVGGAVREEQVLSGIATCEASPHPAHPSPASFPLSFVSLVGNIGGQPRCHGRAGVMSMSRVGFLRKFLLLYPSTLVGVGHSALRLWLSSGCAGEWSRGHGVQHCIFVSAVR